jgi:hypothetical protein
MKEEVKKSVCDVNKRFHALLTSANQVSSAVSLKNLLSPALAHDWNYKTILLNYHNRLCKICSSFNKFQNPKQIMWHSGKYTGICLYMLRYASLLHTVKETVQLLLC